MLDEDTKQIVEVVTKGGVKGTLETLGGAAPEEFGHLVADLIRWQRVKVQVKILQKYQALMDSLGLAAGPVPPKVLVPLLELGGLEDEADDEMQERWAALLANAASDGAEGRVMPSFPQILSELTSTEARMLEWVANTSAGSSLDNFKAVAGLDPTRTEAEQPLFDVYVENLERLKLVDVHRADLDLHGFQNAVVHQLDALQREVGPITLAEIEDLVEVSHLGKAFVAACSPPREHS